MSEKPRIELAGSFGYCYPVQVKPGPQSITSGTVQAEVIGAAKASTTARTILPVRRDIRTPFVWETIILMPDDGKFTSSMIRR
ncbi:MAG: hypothetical protein EPN51_25275 [Mycobacterium sp.]|nr:MAG: hypothetical protein EPN51_25275 [Mycobacterium sp.]